ncbi:hypothetical protein DFJ74DRAFT_712446 [Hyaloraphidium curvatum]|nr:hypothetical protein DFJ74DRAFT_712446 [Hyaloraphidium curvatum]
MEPAANSSASVPKQNGDAARPAARPSRVIVKERVVAPGIVVVVKRQIEDDAADPPVQQLSALGIADGGQRQGDGAGVLPSPMSPGQAPRREAKAPPAAKPASRSGASKDRPAKPSAVALPSPTLTDDSLEPLPSPTTFSYPDRDRGAVELWFRAIRKPAVRGKCSKSVANAPVEIWHLFACLLHLIRTGGRGHLVKLLWTVDYSGDRKKLLALLQEAKGIFNVKQMGEGPVPASQELATELDLALFRVGMAPLEDPQGSSYGPDSLPPIASLSSVGDANRRGKAGNSLASAAFRTVWEAGGCLGSSRLDTELQHGFPGLFGFWKQNLDAGVTATTACGIWKDVFVVDEATRRSWNPRQGRPKYVTLGGESNSGDAGDEQDGKTLMAKINAAFLDNGRLVLGLEELAVLVLPPFPASGDVPFPRHGLLNFLLEQPDFLICDRVHGIDVPQFVVARLASFDEGSGMDDGDILGHPLGTIPAFARVFKFLMNLLNESGGSIAVADAIAASKKRGSSVSGPFVDGLLQLVGGWEQLCRILDEAGLVSLSYTQAADGNVRSVISLPNGEAESPVAAAAPASLPLPYEYLLECSREIYWEVSKKLPGYADLRVRQVVIDKIQKQINLHWGDGIRVFAFGSTSNGLGTRDDDLDLCIVTEKHGVDSQGPWLSMYALANILRRCGFAEVLPIAHARIPIVKIKFVSYDGIEVAADINVNNSIALYNTRLLRTYCLLDPRVRPFLMAIKKWSKCRRVNNPSGGWLSSYSFVLMGLTFLVMRGVVPCLQQVTDRPRQFCTTVLPGSTKTPRTKRPGSKPMPQPRPEATTVDVTFRDLLEFSPTPVVLPAGKGPTYAPPAMTQQLVPLEAELSMVAYKSENEETLTALLHGFFDTYSRFNRRKLAVSLRDGAFIERSRDRFRGDAWVTEDPFIEHNTTRNVNDMSCITLMAEFRRAADEMAARKPFSKVCEVWQEPQ